MNKIEIKSLATGEVIFSHEADNNTIRATVEKAVRKGVSLPRADLSWANLYRADLSWANLYRADLPEADLSGANLYRAYLSGANLSGANLSGATLYGVIGDGIIIRSAQFEKYHVVICDDWLQIGCKGYRVHEWIEFSDARIKKMDDGALEWWKANKAAVFAFAGWDDELSIAK